jgi:AGZA family xanthine/uracil permease-like MFS transporter
LRHSSGTAYIESVVGIDGWATGLTRFHRACFLPCSSSLRSRAWCCRATAAVLILVGAAMFRSVGEINFSKIEEGVPAFLTLVLIPLTFSITQGILWGFISHVGLYLMVGRRREIHPVMYVLALVSIGLLVLERVKF